MSSSKLKKAAELAWQVKGRLWPSLANSSEKELDSIIREYTDRMFNNEEGYLYTEGFDEAWQKFINDDSAS